MVHTEGCDGRHSVGECSDVVAARVAAARLTSTRRERAPGGAGGDGRLRTIGAILVVTRWVTLVVGVLFSIAMWAAFADDGKGGTGFMVFLMGIWTTIWTGLSMLGIGGMVPVLLRATYDAERAALRGERPAAPTAPVPGLIDQPAMAAAQA
jgi:hypothetical protein